MGAFGVIGAIGQKLHEQNLLNLQDKLNTHTAMLKMAQESAEKYPNLAPQYYNMALQIAATPVMKFDPKKFDLTAPRMEWERQQASQPKPQPPSVNPAAPPPRAPEQSQNPFSLPTTGPASRATDQPQQNPETLAPLAQAPSPPPGMQPSSAQLAIGGTPPMFADLSQAPAFSPLHKMALDVGKKDLEYASQYGHQYEGMTKAHLAQAINERSLREQDLVRLKPLIAALPDKPGMKDIIGFEAAASSILGRTFTLPGMAGGRSTRPQFVSVRSGDTAPPGTLDVDEQPITPGKEYRIYRDPLTGDLNWHPTIASAGSAVMPDPESKTGFSIFKITRTGAIQGKAVGALPPAEYAPVTRNGTRYIPVNFGDHEELVPVQESATTQRAIPGGGGVPPPPGTPPASQSAPPVTPPATGAAWRPAPPGDGRPRGSIVLPKRALTAEQVNQKKIPIEIVSHQLWGDPDNPSLRPLASYAKLADDPAAKARISKALRLIIDAGGPGGAAHIGASAGPFSASTGALGSWLQDTFGVTANAAEANVKVIQKALANMPTEEVDYINSLMNAIPTVTGLRALTRGSAFKWSQQSLERELPMIGLGATTNADSFRKKLVSLGDEPLTAIQAIEKTNPGTFDPRLIQMMKGELTGPPGSSAPAVGTIMKGYRFKGGNPADQASWEKVK